MTGDEAKDCGPLALKSNLVLGPNAPEWAMHIAAQCWCEPTTSMIEMDARLALVFAEKLAAGQARLLDVAMMLRTCAWALRRGTSPDLGERALELLKKHDLLGSPLRADLGPNFNSATPLSD